MYNVHGLGDSTLLKRQNEGKEVQKGGDICMIMMDLHCCTYSRNQYNIVKQISSN